MTSGLLRTLIRAKSQMIDLNPSINKNTIHESDIFSFVMWLNTEIHLFLKLFSTLKYPPIKITERKQLKKP